MRYRLKSQLLAKKLEEIGFTTICLLDGFTEKDFADRVHFSESGGAKLAVLVAEKLRIMSRGMAGNEEAEPP